MKPLLSALAAALILFSAQGVVEHMGNELFGELVRPVIIRTPGNHRGKIMGVVECGHKAVGAGLGRRIRAARVKRRAFRKKAFRPKRTVYFICGYLHITLYVQVQAGLNQHLGANYVCGDKRHGATCRPFAPFPPALAAGSCP